MKNVSGKRIDFQVIELRQMAPIMNIFPFHDHKYFAKLTRCHSCCISLLLSLYTACLSSIKQNVIYMLKYR